MKSQSIVVRGYWNKWIIMRRPNSCKQKQGQKSMANTCPTLTENYSKYKKRECGISCRRIGEASHTQNAPRRMLLNSAQKQNNVINNFYCFKSWQQFYSKKFFSIVMSLSKLCFFHGKISKGKTMFKEKKMQ